MPIAKVQMPDGRIGRFEVPEGTTEQEVMDFAAKNFTAPDPKAASAEPSIADRVGRVAGLTGRYLAEGLTDLPVIAGDAVNTVANVPIAAMNEFAGTNIRPFPMLSAAREQALSALPRPETGPERIFGAGARAMSSIPASSGLALASGAKAASPFIADLMGQTAAAAGSGIGGQATAEITDNPFLQTLGAFAGGVAGAKSAAGLEPNPIQTDRIRSFEKAQIDPSYPDVTQGRIVQGGLKVLENVPLSGGSIQASEQARLAQAQQAAGRVAAAYGESKTPADLGTEIQKTIQKYRYGATSMTPSEIIKSPTYKTSISAKEGALLSRIAMPPDTAVPIQNAATKINEALNKYSNQGLSNVFADSEIGKWKAVLDKSNNTLSWADLRQFRTDVRYMRNKPSLISTVDDRALGEINKALTQDMVAGAKAQLGDTGAKAVMRADAYYAKAMDRVDKSLTSIFNVKAPEQAYGHLERALLSGSKGDIGKVIALKRSMEPAAWGDVAATVIESMGTPRPSAVEGFHGGIQFSVASFGTKYNAMSDAAKNALFGQAHAKPELDNLFNALELMKGTERLANTSQSGSRLINATSGGVIGFGAFSAPMATAISIGAAKLSAHALYSPTFVRLMANSVKAITPAAKTQVILQMTKFAAKNPEFENDASTIIQTMQDSERTAGP